MRTRSQFLSVVVTVVLTLSATAVAQVQPGPYRDTKGLPDTPAARRLNEFLDVVRSGGAERMRSFITEKFTTEFRDSAPMEEHLDVLSGSAEAAARFELYGWRQYDPPRPETTLVAIFRDSLKESWQAIVVDVEPNPPHRIAGIRFAPARPPSDQPPVAKRTEAEAVAELERFLDRLGKADAFSGAVLLAKDDKVLLERAYGQACKSFDVPNNIGTKFNLGSMNKMFTAVAIAQLAERGKLSFTDPIGKYLGLDWLPQEVAEKITIEHLLTHTSGLGSYFNEEFMNASRARFRVVEDYRSVVSKSTLQFEPGTRWSYSNTGFLLLGAIIEKVTGQSYFDYVRDNIARPAGMPNTDCYDMDESVPNLALGYIKANDAGGKTHWRTNLFEHVIKGGPAGGGFSTVRDLWNFDRALRSNKLLSAASTKVLWTPKPGSPDYGYGFGLHGQPGNRIVGHSGGFPGISAWLGIHLDTGYTLAVLSNYDDGAEIVHQKVNELLGVSP